MSITRLAWLGLVVACVGASAVGGSVRKAASASNLDGLGSTAGADERGLPVMAADNCANATPITGLGMFGFNLMIASTDGLGHPQCNFFGNPQIWRDVWYAWTSVVDGEVTIALCDLVEPTSLDTKLAVYSPAAPCVPTNEFVIACGDDDCGLQSRVSFIAQAGQVYLVRIGRFSDVFLPTANGSILISAAGVDVCAAIDTNGDGVINFADLNNILSAYNTSCPFCAVDTNGDGVINFADLNNILSAYNTSCP